MDRIATLDTVTLSSPEPQAVTYAYDFDFVTADDGLSLSAKAASLLQGNTVATTVARKPAVSFEAHVLTETVYSSSSQVTVVISVRDGDFNYYAQATTLRVELRPSAVLSAESGDSAVVVGTCTTSVSTGVCSTQINARAAWLSGRQPNATAVIEVFAGFTAAQMQWVDAVATHPNAPLPSDLSNVLLTVPSQPFYRGQTVVVTVTAYFDFTVGGYAARVVSQNPSSVAIVSAAPVSSAWDGSPAVKGSSEVAMVYRLLDLTTVVPAADPQPLFTVTLQVSSSAGENAAYGLFVELSELSDTAGTTQKPSGVSSFPAAGLAYDRRGLVTSGPAQVNVGRQETLAIIARAQQARLLNTVSLRGQSVSSPISVLALTNRGTLVPLSSGLTFTSSNQSAATTNAAGVLISSSQTVASHRVNITVAATGGLSTVVPVSVATLQGSVAVTVDDGLLSPVAGWVDPTSATNNCNRLMHQSTGLTVTASFGFTPSELVFTGPVTAWVANAISVGNSTVARVVQDSHSRPRIQGLTAGTTTILLAGSSTGATVTVQDENPVTAQLVLTPVNTVTVSTGSGTVFGGQSQQSGTVSLVTNKALRSEGDSVKVYASVVFSDDTAMELDPAVASSGVVLSSADDAQVTVSGAVAAVAVGASSGAAPYVAGRWMPNANTSTETCFLDSLVVAEAVAPLTIVLPAPTSATISGIPSRLVPASDPAASAGQSSSTTITVRLAFESGSPRDMTLDRRTVYDDSQAAGVFEVDTSSSTSVTVRALKAGQAPLRVTFSNAAYANISTTVTVTVTASRRLTLAVSPLPSYPGSTGVSKTTLSAYAGSNPPLFQSAQLTATLELLDGLQISNAAVQSGTTYAIYDDQGQLNTQDNVLRLAASRTLTGVAAGEAAVYGTFVGLRSESPLNMTVAAQPITVAQIDSVSLQGGLTTLSGVVNQTTVQTLVAVTWSDGTAHTALFDNNGNAAVPGLVSFSSSSSSVASVTGASGRVTLRANNQDAVTVTAALAASALTGSVSFACNLQPAVGDMDVGRTSGSPLPELSVGQEYNITVRANVGSTPLGNFNLQLQVDEAVAAFVRATFPYFSGNLDFRVEQDTIRFGGTVSPASVTGTANLAVITLRAVGSGSASLTATILGLGDRQPISVSIGSLVGQASVAGSVPLRVTGSRRREVAAHSVRSSAAEKSNEAVAVRHRRSTSALGDLTGDGKTDPADVQFLQLYAASALVDFGNSDGPIVQNQVQSLPGQLRDLDVDGDGVVSGVKDAQQLVRIAFGNQYFVTWTVTAPSANDGSCELQVDVTVLAPTGAASGVAHDKLKMFVDWAAASPSVAGGLPQAAADVTTGTFITNSKSSSQALYGSVVELQYTGSQSLYTASVRINAAVTNQPLGLSLVQVTADDSGTVTAVLLTGNDLGNTLNYTSQLQVTLPTPVANKFVTAVSSASGYNALDTVVVSSPLTDCSSTSPTVPTSASTATTVATATTTAGASTEASTNPTTPGGPTSPSSTSTPCAGGDQYYNTSNSLCQPTTSCDEGAGEFELQAPTLVSDRRCATLAALCPGATVVDQYVVVDTATGSYQCLDVSSCSGETYISVNATSTSDIVCANITACPPDWVEIAPPSTFGDRVCAPQAPGCAVGQYNAGENGLLSCEDITDCQADEYEFRPPTSTSDRVCLTYSPACNMTLQFEFSAAGPSNDRVCIGLRICNATEYETQAATFSTDRECAPLLECELGVTFQSLAPTATSNRQCEPVSGCNLTIEYVAANATLEADIDCQAISSCNYTVEFEAARPTDYSDRLCLPITVCEEDQFIAINATATSNVECRNYTQCPPAATVVLADSRYKDVECRFDTNARASGKSDNARTTGLAVGLSVGLTLLLVLLLIGLVHRRFRRDAYPDSRHLNLSMMVDGGLKQNPAYASEWSALVEDGTSSSSGRSGATAGSGNAGGGATYWDKFLQAAQGSKAGQQEQLSGTAKALASTAVSARLPASFDEESEPLPRYLPHRDRSRGDDEDDEDLTGEVVRYDLARGDPLNGSREDGLNKSAASSSLSLTDLNAVEDDAQIQALVKDMASLRNDPPELPQPDYEAQARRRTQREEAWERHREHLHAHGDFDGVMDE